MKVIRLVTYEGSEEWLRKQMGNSMPPGVRFLPEGTLDIRVLYSDLNALDEKTPAEIAQMIEEATK